MATPEQHDLGRVTGESAATDEQQDRPDGEQRAAWPRFWRRWWQQLATTLGSLLLLLLVMTALAAPFIAATDPFATSNTVLAPPSHGHPLGTDDLGRDLWSRVVYGTRVSLLVGLVAVGTATVVGIVIGGVAGYVGGWVDDVLMRLTEVFLVVPRFFLVLVVVALLGNNIWLTVALLALTFWPTTARLLRGQVLVLRGQEYVLAAQTMGLPPVRILVRHVLPGALPPVIVQAALNAGGAILVEASLSFLGLSDRNVVSWGSLLNDAQQFVRVAWWLSVFPGVAITLTILSLSLVADGLNEVWNVRLAGR